MTSSRYFSEEKSRKYSSKSSVISVRWDESLSIQAKVRWKVFFFSRSWEKSVLYRDFLTNFAFHGIFLAHSPFWVSNYTENISCVCERLVILIQEIPRNDFVSNYLFFLSSYSVVVVQLHLDDNENEISSSSPFPTPPISKLITFTANLINNLHR